VSLLDLPMVTLVTIATRDHDENVKALDRCLSRAKFAKVCVFTNEPRHYAGHTCFPVTPRTSDAWSVWRTCEFPKFRNEFHGSHILFIESDSSIIATASWRDRFLRYDYIGARWFDGRIGNSGFCLMSKVFLTALDVLKIEPTADACHPCDCAWSSEFGHDGRHFHRRRLEDLGVKWADPELADCFASESFGYLGSFGIHGRALMNCLQPL